MYRQHRVSVTMGGHHFDEVWIDPHYEEKHKDSINDELILEMIKDLDGWLIVLSAVVGSYSFYEADGAYDGKMYRLILVVPSDNSYLGVRNAYRRSK